MTICSSSTTMRTCKAKDIKTRHSELRESRRRLPREMYSDAEEAPDDLIHVTCSGYLAPSPVERMVAGKEWFNTTVTHSYHMGCYGAFPAIKMAHGFLSSSQFAMTKPKDRVDIVHTEVLSVHRDIEELKAENIITMTLFADGFIKYFDGDGRPSARARASRLEDPRLQRASAARTRPTT